MRRDRINFETVRDIGLSLPGVEDSTVYRSPALKVRGKLLTCIPVHRSVEPDSLAVSIEFEKRSVLLSAAPDIYYVTNHYSNYPIVLVRLSRIGFGELRNLLRMAWQFVNEQTHRPARLAGTQAHSRTRKR